MHDSESFSQSLVWRSSRAWIAWLDAESGAEDEEDAVRWSLVDAELAVSLAASNLGLLMARMAAMRAAFAASWLIRNDSRGCNELHPPEQVTIIGDVVDGFECWCCRMNMNGGDANLHPLLLGFDELPIMPVGDDLLFLAAPQSESATLLTDDVEMAWGDVAALVETLLHKTRDAGGGQSEGDDSGGVVETILSEPTIGVWTACFAVNLLALLCRIFFVNPLNSRDE